MTFDPDVCRRCGRTLRPAKSTLVDFPGTVSRTRPGDCQTCWQIQRRQVTREVSSTGIAFMVSGLRGFLAERRRRGVPAEGVLFYGEQLNPLLEELTNY